MLASSSHMDASAQREALNCGRELLYLLCGLSENHFHSFHLISPCLTSLSQSALLQMEVSERGLSVRGDGRESEVLDQSVFVLLSCLLTTQLPLVF